jgi:hypothetical protein
MKKSRAPDAPDYRSPHKAGDGVGTTTYLGVDRAFYNPVGRGREATHAEALRTIRERRQATIDDGADPTVGT